MNSVARRIKEIFDPYYEAPMFVWERFASYLTRKRFAKNEEIKPAHSIEKNLYFISEGAAGIFLWKENQPVCIDLHFENEFFGDYASLLTQSVSPLYTMCFEETEMFAISYDNLMSLYKDTEFGVRIGKIAAENLFIHKQAQQIELLTMTAEERYKQLLEKEPRILQRVPLKYVASFLGITPESLSRIRKQLKEGK